MLTIHLKVPRAPQKLFTIWIYAIKWVPSENLNPLLPTVLTQKQENHLGNHSPEATIWHHITHNALHRRPGSPKMHHSFFFFFNFLSFWDF